MIFQTKFLLQLNWQVKTFLDSLTQYFMRQQTHRHFITWNSPGSLICFLNWGKPLGGFARQTTDIIQSRGKLWQPSELADDSVKTIGIMNLTGKCLIIVWVNNHYIGEPLMLGWDELVWVGFGWVLVNENMEVFTLRCRSCSHKQ